MPLHYRVPFQSTCGVFWTLYLSIMNAKYVLFLSDVTLINPWAERTKSKTHQTYYEERWVDQPFRLFYVIDLPHVHFLRC
jgi:hypothetical protein